MVHETRLVYQDQTGAERVLRIGGQGGSDRDGVMLSVQVEPLSDGEIVYATVENRGGESVRLRWLSFEVHTGFDSASPGRFFKHGFQSWSASYPVAISHSAPVPTRSLLTRI